MHLSGYTLETLARDGEFVLCRGHSQSDQHATSILVLMFSAENPRSDSVRRMEHEYALRQKLDSAWAVRAVELSRKNGRSALVLQDPGGEPLDRLLGTPLELGQFLRIAIGVAAALTHLHAQGLVHKDLKPANVMVDPASGRAWLMGFGIASQPSPQRQSPEPPEVLAGTLAYMAPEQTGRAGRPVDSRGDLYALGVMLYEMLTGSLPFTATDAMDWVHCHLARQPVPPEHRRDELPLPISAIVMKLLAKMAEERYQTAAGLERDLRRCLAEWQSDGRVSDFPLGEHDKPDRLQIPEKLYGRARELENLLASFQRVLASGAPELVLVSGYSGIGKSSLVTEFQKIVTPASRLFASGKSDQYKREIPYGTLAQAFQSLIRCLLCESEAELANWRSGLREALGPNGRLMLDLVPELKLIIGDQPPVPKLPPHDAQRRFHLVFRRFIAAFARPEHPLALFLDDLQWLDAATLELIEDLLTDADVRHLLVIGAYRDNEIDAAPSLARKIEAIQKAGAQVQEMHLGPLGQDAFAHLIADALRCDPAEIALLAQLVHGKTAGNPFFAIQFLSSLADEGLLTFDHDAARWSWELDRIDTKRYTDNVADLMIGKLARLPSETQTALQQMACLGSSAAERLLSTILGTSEEQVGSALCEALHAGLIERQFETYRFIHDRVREAAYSLIPEPLRAAAHLRIGRILFDQPAAALEDESVFAIANHFNLAQEQLAEEPERRRIAELNLRAGRIAKARCAYDSAITYFAAAEKLLSEHSWQTDYDLTFQVHLRRARCEWLLGRFQTALQSCSDLRAHARRRTDLVQVYRLQLSVHGSRREFAEAATLALSAFSSLFGNNISAHPSGAELREAMETTLRELGGRSIESLASSDSMNNAEVEAEVALLHAALGAATNADPNLGALLMCQIVSLSLRHGPCLYSPLSYLWFGIFLARRFGRWNEADQFARLAVKLAERPEFSAAKGTTDLSHAAFLTWIRPLREAIAFFREALQSSLQEGVMNYACIAIGHIIEYRLIVGDPLPEVLAEAEEQMEFTRSRDKMVFPIIADVAEFVTALREAFSPSTPYLSAELQQAAVETARATGDPWVPAIHSCYAILLQLLREDYEGAVAAARAGAEFALRLYGSITQAEYQFYAALAFAAHYEQASSEQREEHLAILQAYQREYGELQAHGPENFSNRYALISAEVARIEGRLLDAEQLYEQAIRSARENGFIQNEALAYEFASRFYRARGLQRFAGLYLRNARDCYLCWGADGKVRQLDQQYRQLWQTPQTNPDARRTRIDESIEHLDLETVLKVCQAVSSEIVLEKLIDTLMRTALAHAGAERGVLVIAHDVELRIRAEATTVGSTVTIALRDVPISNTELPVPVVQYASRTLERVILDDASAAGQFANDDYVRREHARSILCLPLVKQGKLIALLYLENNLAANIFTPAKIAILQLLSSAAAISLENSRLYRELQQREAKIRRLVDANIIGVVFWDADGRVIDANEAFLQMLRYTREDITSGRLQLLDLTPPEWMHATQHALDQLRANGSCELFEKGCLRSDGTRMPALIGAAVIGGTSGESVAFVLDVTQRKRAEEALRRSEQLYSGLVNSVEGIVWQADASTFQFTYVSPRAEQILGYSAEQWLTTNFWAEHLHPEDAEWCVQFCKDATENHRDHEFEYRMIAADGRTVWLRDLVNVQTEPDGRGCLRGVMIDITDRKKAEDAVRNGRQLLQDIIDNSSALIYVKDLEGRFLLTNRALDSMMRTSALSSIRNTTEPMLGKTSHELLAKEQADASQKFDQQVLAAGTVLQTEDTVPQQDGLHTYVSIKAPLRDQQGKPYAICGMSTDITERKHLEEQLRELAQRLINAQEEERARIARELHDDVGQQIATLGLSIDDLRRKISATQREAREQAGRIQSQAAQLAAGIRNLSHELHPTILELVGLSAALRFHCGEFSSQSGVSVAFEASERFDDLPSPQALCIYRVVQETLQNVARHSHAKRAEVRIQRSSGGIVLTVSDPGVGFDLTQHRASAGLGLVSIRERVRLVNGTLAVESAPHRGTTVRVEIPLRGSGNSNRTTPQVLGAA